MKSSKADKYFSLFVRLRDCNEDRVCKCCTCDKIIDVKYADNSHFIGRQHMATRFSEMNCNTACKKCNGFEEGKKDVYRRFLVEKYGENKVLMLENEARKTRKISKFELDQIAKFYKSAAENLAKEKGLKLW
jgi:hypothetical protein